MSARALWSIATLLLAFLGLLAQPSLAQESAASCDCDAKGGTLVIRYTPDIAEEKPAWPTSPPAVRFMSLLVLDKDQTTVEDTESKTFACKLKVDQFDVVLEPGVPNPNLLGRCGAAVTGVITVTRNGAVVLEEREFEAMNCHERKKYIRSITFTDGAPKPVIVQGAYKE